MKRAGILALVMVAAGPAAVAQVPQRPSQQLSATRGRPASRLLLDATHARLDDSADSAEPAARRSRCGSGDNRACRYRSRRRGIRVSCCRGCGESSAMAFGRTRSSTRSRADERLGRAQMCHCDCPRRDRERRVSGAAAPWAVLYLSSGYEKSQRRHRSREARRRRPIARTRTIYVLRGSQPACGRRVSRSVQRANAGSPTLAMPENSLRSPCGCNRRAAGLYSGRVRRRAGTFAQRGNSVAPRTRDRGPKTADRGLTASIRPPR